jgi:hypothetical protein
MDKRKRSSTIIEEGIVPFLHKPFRLAELERAVEAIIGKYEARP